VRTPPPLLPRFSHVSREIWEILGRESIVFCLPGTSNGRAVSSQGSRPGILLQVHRSRMLTGESPGCCALARHPDPRWRDRQSAIV